MMSTAPRPREAAPLARLLSMASLVVSVVCGAAVAVLPTGPVRLFFLGVAVLTVPGLAITSLLAPRDLPAIGALTVGTSIATWTVLSQGMALVDLWHPYRLFLIVCAASIVASALLVRTRRADEGADEGAAGAPVRAASTQSSVIAVVAPLIAGLAALACFGITVADTDPTSAGNAGLVQALPVVFFLGLALALGGFVFEIFRDDPRPLVLGWFVAITVLLLFGTAAAISEVPRFAWTYKHVGVAEYIQANGSVDRNLDIYNNWPGFFSLSAFVSEISGTAVLDLARWAQLFFGAANALSLTYVVTSLTTDVRVRSLTVMVFVLGNWVGQDYFAPQALGFVLTLVLVGLALSALSRQVPRSAFSTRVAQRIVKWFGRTSDVARDMATSDHRGAAPEVQRRAAAVLLLLFLGVTVTHQLSPFMDVLIIGGFVLLRRMVHRWLPIAMVLMIIGWIALAKDYFDAHPELLRLRLSRRNVNAAGASDNYFDFSRISSGGHVVQLVSLGICVFIWFAAAFGIVRRLRSGFTDIEAVVLLAAPGMFLAGNSYGGEGILRVYLFSLPGAAFLAASGLLPRRSSWQRPGARLATLLFVVVTAVGFSIAGFGRDQFNLLRPGEVSAARTLETSVPKGSTLTTFGAYWPYGSTSQYPVLGFYVRRVLVEDKNYVHRAFIPDDAEFIADEILANTPDGGNGYLAAGASQQRFVTTYGLMPKGEYEHLLSIIDSSPRFTRWLTNDDTVIWQALPPQEPQDP